MEEVVYVAGKEISPELLMGYLKLLSEEKKTGYLGINLKQSNLVLCLLNGNIQNIVKFDEELGKAENLRTLIKLTGSYLMNEKYRVKTDPEKMTELVYSAIREANSFAFKTEAASLDVSEPIVRLENKFFWGFQAEEEEIEGKDLDSLFSSLERRKTIKEDERIF